MHIFLIVTLSFSGLFAFSFLLAGWLTLIQTDAQEQMELRQQIADARRQAWAQGEIRAFRWMRSEALADSRILKNWRDRRETRTLIYLGTVFLAIAVGAGYFLGGFQ